MADVQENNVALEEAADDEVIEEPSLAEEDDSPDTIRIDIEVLMLTNIPRAIVEEEDEGGAAASGGSKGGGGKGTNTKNKAGGKEATDAKPTEAMPLLIEIERVDGSTERIVSPIIARPDSIDESRIKVGFNTKYTIGKKDEALLDRLVAEPLKVFVYGVWDSAEESDVSTAPAEKTLFGTALVDLSALVRGDISVEGSYMLNRNPKLHKQETAETHEEGADDARSAAADDEAASASMIQLSIRSSIDICCEREWEQSVAGEWRIEEISGLPERWSPPRSPPKDGGRDSSVEEDEEQKSKIQRRFQVEFQWPFSYPVREGRHAISADNTLRFDSARKVYISAEAADLLERMEEPMMIKVRMFSDGDDNGFIADSVEAWTSLDLRQLLQPGSNEIGGRLSLRITQESLAVLEQEREQMFQKVIEERQMQKEEQEKAAAKTKGGGGKQKGSSAKAEEETAEPESDTTGAGEEDDDLPTMIAKAGPIQDPFLASKAELLLKVHLDRALRVLHPVRARQPSDIVAPFEREITAIEPASAEQLLRIELRRALRLIAERYETVTAEIGRSDGRRVRKELVFQLNQNGIYYAFKERLKVAVARLAHQQRSFSSEDDDEIGLVERLYKALSQETAKVLNAEFARDEDAVRTLLAETEEERGEGAEEERTVMETEKEEEEQQRHSCEDILSKADEAMITADDNDVDVLEKSLRLFEPNTADGITLRLRLIGSMQRRGLHAEAEQSLRELVAHNGGGDIMIMMRLRARLALMMLEKNADEEDAAILQRFNADNATVDDEVLQKGLRAVGLRLAQKHSIARYMLRQASGHGEQTLVKVADFCVEAGAEKALVAIIQWREEMMKDDAGDQGKQSSEKVLWLCRIASVHAKLGHWDKAIEASEKALAIDRKCSAALEALGTALWQIGRTDEAGEVWQTMLKLRNADAKGNAVLLARLAQLYLRTSRNDDAVFVLQMALEKRPEWATLWKWLGEALLRKNSRDEDAVDALAEANLRDRFDAATWGMLAIACFRLQRFEEARQCRRWAKRLGLQRQDLWSTLVHHYEHAKRFDEAIDIAQSSLEDRTVLHRLQTKLNRCDDEPTPLAAETA